MFLFSAAMVFVSGGMFLADQGKPEYFTCKHLAMSWFIGAIIGAVIGSVLCNKIYKKLITCFASLLVTISGILLIADSDSYDALLAARYLNGGALGLVFPLTMVLISEETVKYMRGMNAAAMASMCLSLGIFLQICYMYIWPEGSFDGTQMMGTLSIFWGFISFIIAFTLQLESPVFYLQRGQEEMAIDVLRRLQRPFTITHETYEQLAEHKLYVAESAEDTLLKSALIGLPALIKLSFYRVFTAASYSFYSFFAVSYASSVLYTPDDFWPMYIYGLCAWLGPMLVLFTLDSKGRKPPMIVGFFFTCSIAFILGGLLHNQKNVRDKDIMTAVMYLLMAYQFFAGLSTASSAVYLTEAFPLAVKSFYVALAFIAEMAIHIVIIAVHSEPWRFNVYDLSDYFYTVGALSLVFFALAIVAMPETKNDTLRECLAKFRKIINYKSD
uniref:Major facilitator superfamily (MFS) profile domain-containing protein n=1 Tax=Stomoxys calcitrans TaxID=35570 RepID=A0A1I8PAA4_STOCA